MKTTIENYRFPDGSLYSGECFKNTFGSMEITGKGNIFYPNGDSYDGQFEGGFVRGFGRYKFSDGDEHTGWFYDGIPEGAGYLNQHSSMCLGCFREGKLNGWGMQIDKKGVFHFGYWQSNFLIQDETPNTLWIRVKMNEVQHLYKGSLVHIHSNLGLLAFGIPQKATQLGAISIIVMQDGTVYIGETRNYAISGWLVKYSAQKEIEYGCWENGILIKSGTLSDFQDTY